MSENLAADVRDTIAKWAKEGAAKPGPKLRMCSDCAFKKGTEANNDEYVAQSAADTVVYEMGQFACHHEKDGKFFHVLTKDGTPKLCAGFLLAKRKFERDGAAS